MKDVKIAYNGIILTLTNVRSIKTTPVVDYEFKHLYNKISIDVEGTIPPNRDNIDERR